MRDREEGLSGDNLPEWSLPELTPQTLRELAVITEKISLMTHGDAFEQKHYALVKQSLPSYENFWRIFILPFRDRNSISIRTDLPKSHEAVCIFNYSIFRATLRVSGFLVQARELKRQSGGVGSNLFYDFLIWLAIAYERLHQLCGALNIYLFDTQKIASGITKWKEYSKSLPPFFDAKCIKKIRSNTWAVSHYRDNIVHGIKWPGGENRVPKIRLKRYLYWSELKMIAETDRAKWCEITIDRLELMDKLWADFVSCIDPFILDIVQKTVAQIDRFPDHEKITIPHQVGQVRVDQDCEEDEISLETCAASGSCSSATPPPSGYCAPENGDYTDNERQ